MKCDKCVGAEKRTGTKTFCPFPACIIKPSIKDNILRAMESRMAALQDHIDRDYNGGMSGYLEAWREVKYWKEAIERGEFD